MLHNTFNKVGRAKSRLRNVDIMSFTDFPDTVIYVYRVKRSSEKQRDIPVGEHCRKRDQKFMVERYSANSGKIIEIIL